MIYRYGVYSQFEPGEVQSQGKVEHAIRDNTDPTSIVAVFEDVAAAEAFSYLLNRLDNLSEELQERDDQLGAKLKYEITGASPKVTARGLKALWHKIGKSQNSFWGKSDA